MPDTPLTIVFDLDGTLVDTAPDLLAALNVVLTAEGHEPVVPADLRHLVGHGARAMNVYPRPPTERGSAEAG